MTLARPACSEIVLDPGQYALALGQSVRIPLPESRPPRVVVIREAGTRRWACCRVLKRHKQLTPILRLAEPLARVKSFALTAHPPLWEES